VAEVRRRTYVIDIVGGARAGIRVLPGQTLNILQGVLYIHDALDDSGLVVDILQIRRV